MSIILRGLTKEYADHRHRWENCKLCQIGCIAYRHVLVRGHLPCDVLFIGEGPGKTEDVLGSPFVGRAGKLLDTWIEEMTLALIHNRLRPLRWAITNLVCCRPTDKRGGLNRPPSELEITNCSGRLREFITTLAQPRFIVTLGRVAADNLPADLPQKSVALVHPAYVNYNGGSGSGPDRSVIQKLVTFILEQELSHAK